jgi:putative protein kinase ArgK-like GTPase of G3E family
VIVRTEATTGRGLDDVIGTVDRFRLHSGTIETRRRGRAASQLRAILGARLLRQIESRVSVMEMGKLVERIVARTIDPYSAVDEVLSDIEPRAARGEGAPASDAASSGVRGPRDQS